MSDQDARLVQLARETGYVPNRNAASLTTRRSSAFGVLVPQLTDVVLATVYDAIELTANSVGFETFVPNTHSDPDEQRRRIGLLLGRHVDGVIAGDAGLDNTVLPRLRDQIGSLVLVNRRFPDILSVICDDRDGAAQVGAHLADLRHTRIEIVSGPRWTSTGRDRTQGCVEALAERGIVVDRALVVETGFDLQSGRRGTEQLPDHLAPPTAIFATSDLAAIGAMGVVTGRSFVPGRDVAIVGFNDIELGRHLPVPLTTANTPLHEEGRRATEMLLALSRGSPVSSLVLPTRLVVRASTCPPPI